MLDVHLTLGLAIPHFVVRSSNPLCVEHYYKIYEVLLVKLYIMFNDWKAFLRIKHMSNNSKLHIIIQDIGLFYHDPKYCKAQPQPQLQLGGAEIANITVE